MDIYLWLCGGFVADGGVVGSVDGRERDALAGLSTRGYHIGLVSLR